MVVTTAVTTLDVKLLPLQPAYYLLECESYCFYLSTHLLPFHEVAWLHSALMRRACTEVLWSRITNITSIIFS